MIGSLLASAVLVLADPAPPPLLPKTAALLEELKQSPEGPAQLPLHHRLLQHYWSDVASDGDQELPEVELLEPGARFSACGKAVASNAYCPESAQIGIDARGLLSRLRLQSSPSTELTALTVLAHEWGHHVNRAIDQGPFKGREEDAADWRAGRHLGWLMANNVLSVEEFTEAANILFRIGDYHQLSPHGYPLTRYRAFTDGVNGEITPGSQFGTWMMDTPETFSEVVEFNPEEPWVDAVIKVYRFEVERGGQIAGNLFSAALGVLNCGFGGSSRACAGALARQGQAMPDGWFRLRKLQLNCYNGVFDILGDGIPRQRIAADRKGQAQRIAQRICSASQ